MSSGAENANDEIHNSRYMQLQGKAFYRGLAVQNLVKIDAGVSIT